MTFSRMPRLLSQFLVLIIAATPVFAQFPATPKDVTIVQSKFHPNVTISYKQTQICETTNGVKSYSGYVNLPPNTLLEEGIAQNYSINTFFWFFEAREDPENAPLSIWLNGGPGSSSLIGLFQENGPCNVNPDSNSTVINPYSWNNKVNMLYFDQPVQTGFSYDSVNPGVLYNDLSTQNIEYKPESDASVEEVSFKNATIYPGTFPSSNAADTANTTTISAHSAWHFAQTWFGEFPQYKPNDKRISIWTESYGGRYGPSLSNFFERQNEKIEKGELKGDGLVDIHLDTLGIINGCIDLQTQETTYPKMLYNNTYGLQLISKDLFEQANHNWTKSGGGLDQTKACREAVAKYDSGDDGDAETANSICSKANDYVNDYVEGVYNLVDPPVGYYDIAHPAADPFPPEWYVGYLAKADVQAALGVPVNFTEGSNSVGDAFDATGDYIRGGYLEDLAYVLSRGVKVALVYGDRDYACNWLGGEDVSLTLNHSTATEFRSAGYTSLLLNSTSPSYGYVRQHGNFSFTRVFDSGHEVPAYQPEAALAIFERALFSKDIATGQIDILQNNSYSSEGPADTWFHKNVAPPSPAPTCYVLEPYTCSDDQWDSVVDGSGLIENYILQDKTGSGNGTGSAGGNWTATATATTSALPSPTKQGAAGSVRMKAMYVYASVLVAFLSFYM